MTSILKNATIYEIIWNEPYCTAQASVFLWLKYIPCILSSLDLKVDKKKKKKKQR